MFSFFQDFLKYFFNRYKYFVSQQNLRESQCVVFAHHKLAGGSREDPEMRKCHAKIILNTSFNKYIKDKDK